MTRQAQIGPEADDVLDWLWTNDRALYYAIDEAIDWIEESPANVRAKVRAFSGGYFGVERTVGDNTYIIVWEDKQDCPLVHFIGPTFLS